ncbi:MAG: hypothetical protein OXG35_07630 [Acidobacteria bacterium]|nr:hypothetical protein [Acidobacteriota bacterium]
MERTRLQRLVDLVVETIAECTGTSNNHQVVTTGDDEQAGRAIADAVERTVDRDPELRRRFMTVRVEAPGRHQPVRLAGLWARSLDGAARKMADTQRASLAFARLNEWTSDGRPADAHEQLCAELLKIAAEASRRIVLIVDDLEGWTTAFATVDEEYALRKVLQTDPEIVLVGVSSTWSADGHPEWALYCGLNTRRAR